MRFLHTADWHLGKRLQGFVLADDQREALGYLLHVVDAEAPDAVVVAGDVFDTPVPPLAALDAWDWFVGELVTGRGIPLVAIPGNHDHPDRLGMNGRVSRGAGLYILNQLSEAHVPVEVAGAQFFGVPFHKPAHVRVAFGAEGAPDDADYDGAMRCVLERVRSARTAGAPAVLVGHAFVAGAGDEPEGEDAIQVGGAGAVAAATFEGFDYVALGHIHGARALDATGSVRYCGSLYPYAFGEAGTVKSVDVVDIGPAGATVRRVPIEASRRVRVIEGRTFAEVLAEAEAVPARERRDYVQVRVTDEGPIDHALQRLRELYPFALLQQPAGRAEAAAVAFQGDARTIGVEDAFRAFYRHVFGEELSGLEADVFRAALQDEVVEELPDQDDAP